jgi:hypothetical protein
MSRRTQTIVLGVLLVILLVVAYRILRPAGNPAPVASGGDEKFAPVNVDNPQLRMDVLKRFMSLEYKGAHRNIFSAAPPPPPPSAVVAPVNLPPQPPPGPPPLTVDAKFFGFVSDSVGNHRRAFFAANNNEDVFIAGEGDTLMGRFRVIKISNTTTELEEISSGRRVTLNMEEGVPG